MLFDAKHVISREQIDQLSALVGAARAVIVAHVNAQSREPDLTDTSLPRAMLDTLARETEAVGDICFRNPD